MPREAQSEEATPATPQKARRGRPPASASSALGGKANGRSTPASRGAKRSPPSSRRGTRASPGSGRSLGRPRTASAAKSALKRKIAELQQSVAEVEQSIAKKKRRLARLKLHQPPSEEQPRPAPRETLSELPPGREPPLPAELMGEALQVWDFLFSFGPQLRLAPLDLEELLDLLRFTGRDCPALAEVFASLSRLLLSDPALAAALTSAIPPHLNFAARVRGSYDAGCVTGDRFNGLRLLPPRLRPEAVQPLTWQTVLRAMLPRLPSFQDLAAYSCFGDAASPSLRERLQALLVQGEEAASARAVLQRDGSTRFSCRPEAFLERVLSAATALETQEMYSLPLPEKLAVLQLLCSACYDTHVVRSFLEQNCEERLRHLAERSSKDRGLARTREPLSGDRLEILEQLRGAQVIALKQSKTNGKKNKLQQLSPAERAIAEQRVAVMEAQGVKKILPQIPAEMFRSIDDEIPEELLDARQKAQLRQARSKAGKQTKKRVLDSVTVENAEATLRSALESREGKAIKAAIKNGRTAGLIGESADGCIYCTATMAAALIALSEIEHGERAAAEAREFEKGLTLCFIRTEPLGTDTFRRNYWAFEGSPALYVECKIRETPEVTAKVLGVIAPSAYASTWKVYHGVRDLWAVLDSLGDKDSGLQAALKARFGLKDRPPTLLDRGHEWLGRLVRREFGRGRNSRITVGTIVGWLPAEGDDRALWHVVHSDGDEEDLDELEVASCLLPESSEGDDRDNTRNCVPQIINSFVNTTRGALAIKDFQIGLSGLRSELLQMAQTLSVGLKLRGGGFQKDLKRSWEKNVRGAETVEELRELILSLEAVVRAVQETPDLRDEVAYFSDRSHQKLFCVGRGHKAPRRTPGHDDGRRLASDARGRSDD